MNEKLRVENAIKCGKFKNYSKNQNFIQKIQGRWQKNPFKDG
jgi:hypothetical protein